LTSTTAIRFERPAKPACSKASHIEPSASSESPQSVQTRSSEDSSLAAAVAMPTAIGSPWPSEPVATSTQEISGVGCPCRREPNSRKVSSSASSIAPAAL